MLKASSVGLRLSERWLVRDVSLEAKAGEFWGVLGPNGSGKSSLLRLLSGECKPSAGAAFLHDAPVHELSPLTLARRRACLRQKSQIEFPFTVLEVVLLGRLPHQPRLTPEPRDRAIALQALMKTHAYGLAERKYSTLSGGEAARVDLARLLAQETQLLLLDEPLNHLDLRHQRAVLELCRALCDEGTGIVAVMHDVNAALEFCDQVLVLQGGVTAASGNPAEVLTEALIADVFETQMQRVTDASGRPWFVPLPQTEREARAMKFRVV